jgi:AcrR family transcriptional regulator
MQTTPIRASSPKAAGRKSRAAILRVAETLFAKQGYQATTLRQISARSGANGALVAYYFGNKEGLWDAVLEEKVASLDALFAPLQDKTHPTSLSDLQEVVRGLFAFVRKDQSFHLLAQRTLLEDRALKNRIAANLWRPFHEQLAHLIHQVSGAAHEEAKLRAHVISAQVQKYGNILCFYYDDLPQDPDTLLARIEEYVVNDLVPTICGPRH